MELVPAALRGFKPMRRAHEDLALCSDSDTSLGFIPRDQQPGKVWENSDTDYCDCEFVFPVRKGQNTSTGL